MPRRSQTIPGRDGNAFDLAPARGHEVQAERGQVATIRNLREHPIDVLLHKDLIGSHHHQAAERFLLDFELSSIGSARAASLEPRVDGSRGGGLTAAQVDAVGRLNGAMRHLSRADRAIIDALVIRRENLAGITRLMNAAGWRWPPQRYAAVRVGEALDQLAEHYGLRTPTAPGFTLRAL